MVRMYEITYGGLDGEKQTKRRMSRSDDTKMQCVVADGIAAHGENRVEIRASNGRQKGVPMRMYFRMEKDRKCRCILLPHDSDNIA